MVAVSQRRQRIRWSIATGATVAAVLLFGPVTEQAAFWNLTLLMMVVLIAWTVAVRTPVARRLLLVLATTAAVVTATEAVIREIRRPPGPWPDFPAQRYLPDVGYCPAPGSSARSRKEVHGRTIFDVSYTIDQQGLRVAPPAGPDVDATLISFGCSFTFGDGGEDDETWPYRVGVRSKGRVKVYNFAYHAWGPHQTLALLEGGRVERVVKPEGRVVGIYLAIWDHVNRSAGLGQFSITGPRYLLTDRRLRRAGMLIDRFPALGFFPALRKSEIYKRAVLGRARPRPTDPGLMAAILAEAKRRFEETYGAGTFQVLLWPGARTDELKAILSDRGLRPQVVALPPGNLMIDGDPHPNPKGQDAAAAFVLRECLSRR